MKASDARLITETACRPDPEKVRIVLDCWYRAIRVAADRGRSFVREGEVDRVRTPIPTAARMDALERLKADGYSVRTVQDGPNETTIEVSW